MVAETLKIRRGRRSRGEHRLDDATPVERPGELGGVVLHPSDRIELYAPADERRRGWLEHRAEPKHSDPCLIPAPHLSKVSRQTPCGEGRLSPTLRFLLAWFVPALRAH